MYECKRDHACVLVSARGEREKKETHIETENWRWGGVGANVRVIVTPCGSSHGMLCS